jgi:hypothetical protein
MYSYLEQILVFERIYHKNLKEFIIKYSRPLRRFLNSEEIVELFQNIEKVNFNRKKKIFLFFVYFRFVQYQNQLFVNVKNYLMKIIFLNHGYDHLV